MKQEKPIQHYSVSVAQQLTGKSLKWCYRTLKRQQQKEQEKNNGRIEVIHT